VREKRGGRERSGGGWVDGLVAMAIVVEKWSSILDGLVVSEVIGGNVAEKWSSMLNGVSMEYARC
jgi:hypothetical protein